MGRGIICATVVLLCVGLVSAAPILGERILMDVGHCWGDQTPSPASDGNHWNNSGGRGATVNLVRASDGTDTGAVWDVGPAGGPPGCGYGGQITGNDRVSNLYPETAQTSLRYWGENHQPGQVILTGMGSLQYDIGLYCYLTDGIGGDDAPGDALTPASTIFALTAGTCPGAVPIEINAVGNTTQMAWFRGVTPDAQGTITFNLTGGQVSGSGHTIAPLNVVDITAVPEPATMGLLLLGGLLLARRRGLRRHTMA